MLLFIYVLQIVQFWQIKCGPAQELKSAYCSYAWCTWVSCIMQQFPCMCSLSRSVLAYTTLQYTAWRLERNKHIYTFGTMNLNILLSANCCMLQYLHADKIVAFKSPREDLFENSSLIHCKKGIVITTDSLLIQIQMSEHNSLLCGGELHDNLFLILSQLSSTFSYHLGN